MSNIDVTIWRLIDSFESSNQMRETLISSASNGEYLGTRLHTVGIAPAAMGWVFRFENQDAAHVFQGSVESHDPPVDSAVLPERQPNEDDDVLLVRPGSTEPVSVKRKRVENLLAKGWAYPGQDQPAKQQKVEKEKKKEKKQAVAPSKSGTMRFAPSDDDIIVMVDNDNGYQLIRRGEMDRYLSDGWMTGWDYYRKVNSEFEDMKIQYKGKLADIEKTIIRILDDAKNRAKK